MIIVYLPRTPFAVIRMQPWRRAASANDHEKIAQILIKGAICDHGQDDRRGRPSADARVAWRDGQKDGAAEEPDRGRDAVF